MTTAEMDRSDELAELHALDEIHGAQLLDDIAAWFVRFIAVTDPDDIYLLTLWTVHTYLTAELYTTPRLQLDSTVPESGKTTGLNHLFALCQNPIHSATSTSPALIPRMLATGPHTILLDEVDRTLAPDRPGVGELLAILNSGYRVGATRPVLVPVKGGGWEVETMPTFAAVAMAGNAPNLPDDTRSRNLRVLLMPDLDGTVEDSDWELISADAEALRDAIARWTDSVRNKVKGMVVDLPEGCRGRSREKWRPLKRVAVAADGRWPALADKLIGKSLAEDAAVREAGIKAQPPGMVLLGDLHRIWPQEETCVPTNFVPTRELVATLILTNPDYWGDGSPYGKQLTEARFGKLLSQASKLTSCRPGGTGPRGFLHSQLVPVWHRLGIARIEPGESGEPGEAGGADTSTSDDTESNRLHRLDFAVPEPGEPGGNPSTSRNHHLHRDNRLNRVDSAVCRYCGTPLPPHLRSHLERGYCARTSCTATARRDAS